MQQPHCFSFEDCVAEVV